MSKALLTASSPWYNVISCKHTFHVLSISVQLSEFLGCCTIEFDVGAASGHIIQLGRLRHNEWEITHGCSDNYWYTCEMKSPVYLSFSSS